MPTSIRLTASLVVFLVNSAVVSRASPAPDERSRKAGSLGVLSRAAEHHPYRLSEFERAAADQLVMGSQLRECHSKKRGALIGGIVGAVAAGAVGVYIVKQVGGVFGTSGGAPKYVAYWISAGAGAGALSGVLFCR